MNGLMTPKPVLIIDDNADDAELTRRALKRCPVPSAVIVADDALEAVAWLTHGRLPNAGFDGLPALVLLDVKMPRVDGFEVVRQLRAHPRTRQLPIVLLTSSAEEQDIRAGYDAGANAYVRKPITSERFIEAVHALGSFWLGHNALPSSAGGGPR
ncbi:MAG: response regulator [Vicinamibacterales bacterium]